MISVEEHIEISRPLADVYRFVIDDHAANHPRWDPDVVAVEQLTPGAVAVGTRFRMVRKVMGSAQQSILEVSELEPDRRVVMTSDTKAMDMVFVNAFEAAGGSTRLTLAARVQPHGPLKMMSPIIRDQFSKGLRRSLQSIRSLLEAGSTAAA